METDRHAHFSTSGPQRIECPVVVVYAHGRVAREHHAAKAHIPEFSDVRDSFVDGAQGSLSEPDQSIWRMGNEFILEPAVVGPEASLLEVGILKATNEHADRRINHFSDNAVA